MATITEKFWWALILRGVLAIFLGVGMLFCQSLSSLGYFFGIFTLTQGILSGLPALTAGSRGTFLAGIEGIIGILIAFFLLIGSSFGAFLFPSVSNVTFLIYILTWMVVTGIVALAMFIRLRGESLSSSYLGLNTLLCLIFSVLLVSRHAYGALGNAGILSAFAILYGLALLLMGRKSYSGRS